MYAASGNESEDEIIFVQPDGAQRILRGTITAENRTDRSGALFTVTLPRVSIERSQRPRK